jgi:predicted nucleotide-binding protein (sugar kinase/HSP70/actin superfamily)
MLFYQQFPFWRTYFEEMGFRVVLSDESNKRLVRKSIEVMVSETCLPVELVHGHVYNLIEKEVDYIFVPFIVNARGDKDNPTNNPNCPWVQSYPFMIKSAFKEEEIRKKLLMPALHFRYFERALMNELSDFMNQKFGVPKAKSKKAILKADQMQMEFENKVSERGKEVLNNLPSDKIPLVILGRPYNTTDPHLNLSLVDKLIDQDTVPIPVDYLPLKDENIFEDYKMMYWPNGQKILSAARIIQKNKNLYAVYLGNFRCGPDSFITHYVREEMHGKPFLHLEVDEHSADAGMITRIEAFLDSLTGYKQVSSDKEIKRVTRKVAEDKLEGRTLYYPYARDTVHALAAASRFCGIDAEVLPMPDEKDLEIARKLTNGTECFPFIATAGTFVRKLMEPGVDPKKVSFFMPDHNGPCRFGDYNKMHRIIFDRLGYYNVEILTPSNDTAYQEVAPGKSGKFRINTWKGIVALDMLKKLLQERRPYELTKGQTEQVYQYWMDRVIKSVETGSKGLEKILNQAGHAFDEIPLSNGERKPVIAILGETFMRDNPFCSAFLVDKLEELGAETIMAPFAEWLVYSTYRYERDSRWKGDLRGIFKSRLQKYFQHSTGKKLNNAVKDFVEMEREIELDDMIRLSAPYVHKDYDGEPVVALGAASGLFETNVSGIIYIMPFTCMPGTIVSSVVSDFRKDHKNIPWETIAYDGQEDVSISTRLQAFMHQAKEYAAVNQIHEIRSKVTVTK